MTVRLSVVVSHEEWRRLRDLAEESKGSGRTSVGAVIRGLIQTALGPKAVTTNAQNDR